MGMAPPKFVRAWRYDYDFAPAGEGNTGGGGGGGVWWRRKNKVAYMPALSLENASIKSYVQQQLGWPWPGLPGPEGAAPPAPGLETAVRRLRGWPAGAAAAALAGLLLAALIVATDAVATRVLLNLLLEGFTADSAGGGGGGGGKAKVA